MLLHFLIVLVSFFMNMCWEDQLWMLLCVLRCCHIYCTKCGKKRPEKGHNGWILNYCSASSRMFMTVQQLLAEKRKALILQPLNLPGLAPFDFLSFPRLKMGFWNKLFLTVEIQCNSQPVHHTQAVSKSACKHGKTNRARVCLQKGYILRTFRQESTAVEIF
jgi:hypothetical protein